MKINRKKLVVLNVISHMGLGGASTLLRNCYNTINTSGSLIDYHIVSLRASNPKPQLRNYKFYSEINKSKYDPSFIVDLIKITAKIKPDVIHCHLSKPLFCVKALKRAFPDTKIIFTEHGAVLQKIYWYPILLRITKNSIDTYVSVSEILKQSLISKARIPGKKILVVSNFVDDKKGLGTSEIVRERKKLGIDKNDFVIGFIGRIKKVKGCEYLIKALPLLNFNFKVLIAGEGKDLNRIRFLVKRKKQTTNVIFLGRVNNIEKVFSVSDVVVLPSLSESFGLTAIEAQSLHVPVIVSDLPVLRETLGFKGALFFQPRNPAELAAKITQLRNNNKQKNMLITAGILNAQKYSLKCHLERLMSLYATSGEQDE